MFGKKFFTSTGLDKFQVNLARNVCHVSVNSALVCWRMLSAYLFDIEKSKIEDMLLADIENLYDEPRKFESKFTRIKRAPLLNAPPDVFNGLSEIFFTYFIRRLPVMLSGRTMPRRRPKAPTRRELVQISEYCINTYEKHFQKIAGDLIPAWRKGYMSGLRWSRVWLPRFMKDKYYYDMRIIENFMDDSINELLEGWYPKSQRFEDDGINQRYWEQHEKWERFQLWFKMIDYVFIDKLAEHLDFAYPIYSSDHWNNNESN